MTDLCTACMTYPPETPGMWICIRCADALHGWLDEIAGRPGRAGLAAELQTEIAKLSRKGRSVGKTASPTPALPYSPEASDCLAAIRWHLVVACKLVTIGQPDGLPADEIEAMAVWLLEHETTLGMRAGVGEVVLALGDAVRLARWLIDVRPERVLVGTCECGSKLMSAAEWETVTCPMCKAKHDAAEKRDELLASVGDKWLTITEMATLLGKPRGTVWHWAEDGDLTQHETDPKRFRLGDGIARRDRRAS